MLAELLPLTGKYYGTQIVIKDGPAQGRHIELWFSTGEPSEREIESWGHTQSQWDNNIEIDEGWGGKAKIQSCDFMCDPHYECKETYRVALAIIEALKGIA
jgi:hypothetical protein